MSRLKPLLQGSGSAPLASATAPAGRRRSPADGVSWKSEMPLHHDCHETLQIIGRDDVGDMAVTLASPAIIGR
ncbi:hypothetical protein [Xanthomonas translucens]|uniref:Uncharacterized protein n=1 Tax=Xanthomonas translucens pv. translucens TaxID=134875 RepID=A0ABW9KYD2_XANCT|nr:hypothetical protein [Xanthomonas translucens]MCS3358468.1 hypothetical protein [Xanthomonas translucens pv. translucens]MCS3372001.1 hypothetical protein [Xanthomonas translucens pv. translucens]MCT8273774.1 hypothetical protein [Xanthomonas translucens pv. translucens]MCT8277040.1 hypothetical protein [Xanthomonas translucens pv. translucens]MCT8288016.1 hypothetical protein [Xanthomonas translucens pv. translucens]